MWDHERVESFQVSTILLIILNALSISENIYLILIFFEIKLKLLGDGIASNKLECIP